MHIKSPFDIESRDEKEMVLSILRQFSPRPVTFVAARYVPQFSSNNSAPIYLFSSGLEFGDPRLTKSVTRILDSVDLGEPGDKAINTERVNGSLLFCCPLNQVYDICIGAICLVSNQPVNERDVVSIAAFIESIIRMKKRAVALDKIDGLSRQIQSEPETNFRAVGNAIYESVWPAEVLILGRSPESHSTFVTYFSQRGDSLTLPQSGSIVGLCADAQAQVQIQDLSNKDKILSDLGMEVHNTRFFDQRSYKSIMICPIPARQSSDVVIVCCFARRNAISKVEVEILNSIATIVSQHIVISSLVATSNKNNEEAARLLNISRHALLIAEIVHDAADDLISARNNLSIVSVSNDVQALALRSAQLTLADLVGFAEQFRDIFKSLSDGKSNDRHRYGGAMFRSVDLRRLLSEIVEKYAEETRRSKITVEEKIPAGTEVFCVPYAMTRAVENLIKNSIYHVAMATHRSRVIRLEYKSRAAGTYLISVRDNGLGTDPESIEKLAVPFFSTRGGMGLGLTIAEAAIGAQGGSVKFSSKFGEYFQADIEMPSR